MINNKFQIGDIVQSNYRTCWYGNIIEIDGNRVVCKLTHNSNREKYKKPPLDQELHIDFLRFVSNDPNFWDHQDNTNLHKAAPKLLAALKTIVKKYCNNNEDTISLYWYEALEAIRLAEE